MSSLDEVTLADFTPCVGETFAVQWAGGAPVALTLIQAEPARHTRPPAAWGLGSERPPRPGFALVLRGPSEPALAQQLYRVEHARLGVLEDLLLVPVGIDGRGRYYEVIFG